MAHVDLRNHSLLNTHIKILQIDLRILMFELSKEFHVMKGEDRSDLDNPSDGALIDSAISVS